jgi:hypothetical protein
MFNCKVYFCVNTKHKALGYCKAHYEHLRKTGDPIAVHFPQTRGYYLCVIAGCNIPSVKKQKCEMHYRRTHNGKEVTAPRKIYRKTAAIRERDSLGRKHCVECENWLPESDYHSSRGSADNLAIFCAICSSVRKYGFTRKTFLALLDAQENKCRICEVSLDTALYAIDHDRSCCAGVGSCGACVRGILCRQCNSGIGMLRDDKDIVLKAYEYLNNWPIR